MHHGVGWGDLKKCAPVWDTYDKVSNLLGTLESPHVGKYTIVESHLGIIILAAS